MELKLTLSFFFSSAMVPPWFELMRSSSIGKMKDGELIFSQERRELRALLGAKVVSG
jgi:hypothetical protein